MAREKVNREKIIEVLTNPEFFLRKEQAGALHITTKTLWLRRKEDSTIDEDVAKIIREGTGNIVARGLQRLERIIDGYGDSSDAIRALKLLLEYRGELKGDGNGAVVNIIMPDRKNNGDD